MLIIRRHPNAGGAYPPPQTWRGETVPEGYAAVADSVDLTAFYGYNGFVTLETAGGVVTGCTPNVEAWEAWKAAQPEPGERPTDKLTELRLAIAELAEAFMGGEA